MRARAPLLRFLLAAGAGAGLTLTWQHHLAPSEQSIRIVSTPSTIPAQASGSSPSPELSFVSVAPNPDRSATISPVGQGDPLTAGGTPYDLTREALSRRQTAESSLVLQSLAQAHEEIVMSGEDAAWTQPIEAQLRNIIFQHPAIGTLEISSLTCRKAGCEIQALGAARDNRRSRQTGAAAGWQAIVTQILSSELQTSLDMGHSSVMQVGDRTVYITTLTRRRAS